MALLRTDPFRDVDRLFQQLWNQPTISRTMSMPIDAYRRGDQFLVRVDLPGVRLEDVEITVEDNVLTLNALRPVPELSGDVETVVAERIFGNFSRQLFLGKNLDTARIEAHYADGVLSIVIPVAESAKARRIEVTGSKGDAEPPSAVETTAGAGAPAGA